jgi:hypothetical protein
MSTIQPQQGHESEYFQNANTVRVSLTTKEQVRAMPKDVPWSQGGGKAYSLSAKVDGSDRFVVVSTWKKGKPFLYQNFTKKSSGPPLTIPGDLGRLTQYTSQDGRSIDPTRQHVTTYNREREASKAGAESTDVAKPQGSISGTVHDVRTQGGSHQTMDAFIESICFEEGAQNPEDFGTFLKKLEENTGSLCYLSYLQ